MTLRFRREIGGLTMRPELNSTLRSTADGSRLRSDEQGQRIGTPEEPAGPIGSNSGRPRRHDGDESLLRVLSQKRGPDTVMLGALATALLCGLIGFAVHFLWVIAVIVMALALGFVIADSRRNRIDLVRQRDEAGQPRERDPSATR